MDKTSITHVSDVQNASNESDVSKVQVGRERLSDRLPPHESYEGRHRWDPEMSWTPEEEQKVIRKTDLYLLSCLCVMVSLPSFPNRRTIIAGERVEGGRVVQHQLSFH